MKINLTKVRGEARFTKVRGDLSVALQNLEDVVKDKLHDSSLNNVIPTFTDGDENKIYTTITEQAKIIKNLNGETNHLQKELSELGKETEFLREVNKSLGKRLKDFKNEKNALTTSLDNDLEEIYKIIKRYDS